MAGPRLQDLSPSFFLNFFLKILFIHGRHTERGRDIGRGRSRLLTGGPVQNSIPGPPGSHSQPKADTQSRSHPGVPGPISFRACSSPPLPHLFLQQKNEYDAQLIQRAVVPISIVLGPPPDLGYSCSTTSSLSLSPGWSCWEKKSEFKTPMQQR